MLALIRVDGHPAEGILIEMSQAVFLASCCVYSIASSLIVSTSHCFGVVTIHRSALEKQQAQSFGGDAAGGLYQCNWRVRGLFVRRTKMASVRSLIWVYYSMPSRLIKSLQYLPFLFTYPVFTGAISDTQYLTQSLPLPNHLQSPVRIKCN